MTNLLNLATLRSLTRSIRAKLTVAHALDSRQEKHSVYANMGIKKFNIFSEWKKRWRLAWLGNWAQFTFFCLAAREKWNFLIWNLFCLKSHDTHLEEESWLDLWGGKTAEGDTELETSCAWLKMGIFTFSFRWNPIHLELREALERGTPKKSPQNVIDLNFITFSLRLYLFFNPSCFALSKSLILFKKTKNFFLNSRGVDGRPSLIYLEVTKWVFLDKIVAQARKSNSKFTVSFLATRVIGQKKETFALRFSSPAFVKSLRTAIWG